jgi:hypothetical protein
VIWLLALFGGLCVIALIEGAVIVGLLFAAGAERQDPTTVDLDGVTPFHTSEPVPAWLVGSEAGTRAVGVRVEACGRCRQTLPADHQCTGRAA